MKEEVPGARSLEDAMLVLHLLEEGILESQELHDLVGEVSQRQDAGEEISLASMLMDKGLIDAGFLSELKSSMGRSVEASTLVLQGGESPESSEDLDVFLRQGWEESVREGQEAGSFGRYREVRVVGKGAMGKVLLAVDPEIGREVAIKILHPERDGHWRAIEKFRREAQITGRLDHPNIVPVHDMGRTPDGSYYFVMKLVSGRSLAEELEETRAFMSERPERYEGVHLLGAFLKICDAIGFAHSRGVIHRDLKPSNFMMGSFGEVLVMDWGLAKDRGEGLVPKESVVEEEGVVGEDVFLTQDGTIMGTPSYMPPEQAMGKIDQVNEQSDIYSLGATLYQILTLEPPFIGSSKEEVLHRVREGVLIPPGERASHGIVPRELEAVVLKAMAHDPKLRYSSVTDLQADLEAFREGRVLSAARYSPGQRLVKWLARHRAISAISLLSLLFLSGVLGWQSWTRSLEREREFQVWMEKALGMEKQVGAVSHWLSREVSVDRSTGLLIEETPVEKKQREQAIEAYLEVARALERALQLRSDDSVAQKKRVEVGIRVGQMALFGREYLLARETFERLVEFGLNQSEVEKWVLRVQMAEAFLLSWRRERLLAVLEDLNKGLSRVGREPGAPLLDDYVLESVRYRDRQTISILAQDLNGLMSKALRSKESGSDPAWSQSERDRAKFVCEVLGRIGLPGSYEPLSRWMEVVADHELAVEVGIALCNTRDPAAQSS
ncbi:MAG: serine/threonine-protein kinase, partial [Planctomycetota bacterium]|nr:serine/threonine-protein kinase [Planctomycetota bacterium]